ncbi:MAG: phosphatidate cytidylyltransferase [Crocinitomicaceae bacterium]|jgi:dolichol kinase|nr:phosphatidate cytidylyltransferase [Crocinitomicaceae bacterium]
MNTDLIHALILAGSFLALFGLAEILYHLLKVQAEYTRKLVHIGTGLLTLLFPLLLSSHWWVLALCSSFALILILSMRFSLLKSINAIDRESVGSLCYPVSVYCCFLAFIHYGEIAFFYIPILILAICDPVAALTGKKWPLGKFTIGKNSKSLMGTAMFFVSAILVIIGIYLILGGETVSFKGIFELLIIASVSAFVEALSGRGYDNLTIPLSVLLCLTAFQ